MRKFPQSLLYSRCNPHTRICIAWSSPFYSGTLDTLSRYDVVTFFTLQTTTLLLLPRPIGYILKSFHRSPFLLAITHQIILSLNILIPMHTSPPSVNMNLQHEQTRKMTFTERQNCFTRLPMCNILSHYTSHYREKARLFYYFTIINSKKNTDKFFKTFKSNRITPGTPEKIGKVKIKHLNRDDGKSIKNKKNQHSISSCSLHFFAPSRFIVFFIMLYKTYTPLFIRKHRGKQEFPYAFLATGCIGG